MRSRGLGEAWSVGSLAANCRSLTSFGMTIMSRRTWNPARVVERGKSRSFPFVCAWGQDDKAGGNPGSSYFAVKPASLPADFRSPRSYSGYQTQAQSAMRYSRSAECQAQRDPFCSGHLRQVSLSPTYLSSIARER